MARVKVSPDADFEVRAGQAPFGCGSVRARRLPRVSTLDRINLQLIAEGFDDGIHDKGLCRLFAVPSC